MHSKRVPLYPTWFRWKLNPIVSTPTIFIFISHMVQMKDLNYKLSRGLKHRFISHMVQMKVRQVTLFRPSHNALYPTWFRWKWYKAHLRKFHIKLYIPHGSDERIFCYSMLNHLKDFISHMVQMKGRLGNRNRLTFNPLYPTWFRWKLLFIHSNSL